MSSEEEPPKGAVAAVEAEPEEPTEEMEGSELIDDPVRMYLREIGRVTLLTAADERRLAQQLHSGKHVDKLEKRFSTRRSGPSGPPTPSASCSSGSRGSRSFSKRSSSSWRSTSR